MSVLVQPKGRSQFIVHSQHKQTPAVPLMPKLYLGGNTLTLLKSWQMWDFCSASARMLLWGCRMHTFASAQHWLNNSQALPHSLSCPPESPSSWSPGHPASGSCHCWQHAGGTCRHHRAQATSYYRSWFNCFNEITAYLFLLFSVYLFCFPVQKLFFTSFLKELLFNSIASINYCITFLQRSIRAMIECNINTKTHAKTLPEPNPCSIVLPDRRGNINRSPV